MAEANAEPSVFVAWQLLLRKRRDERRTAEVILVEDGGIGPI